MWFKDRKEMAYASNQDIDCTIRTEKIMQQDKEVRQ
jgi:hypothetical protein